MASLSNINGIFDVHSTGAILFSTSHGTSGQILRSNGNAAPTWVDASTVIGGPYLPLTGGTLTGPLSGTSATFSDNIYLADDEALNFGTSNAFNLRWNSTAASGQGASIIDSNRIFIETNFFQLNSRSGTPRLTISGSTSTFAGNVACGDPAGTNTGVRIYYGAGTGDYGSIRFYSNAINTNTIHAFSDTWQSGTIFTKSSGAINIDGNTGVTFGAWSLVDVAFKSGGPNYFRGNVGIGTTTPFSSAKLDVNGNIYAKATAATIDVVAYNTTSGLANADLHLAVTSSGEGQVRMYGNYPLTFYTSNTERMRILDDGSQTQIKGKHGGGADLLLYNTDVTLATNQMIGRLGFYKTDGSGSNVGVSSSIQVRATNSGAGSYMTFHTDGETPATQEAERMRITSVGNSLFNYTNSTIETYGSGAYGGKVVIKASGAEGLALLNNAIGGSSQVAINFTNEFVANQYNWLARIIAEPEQSWSGTASTRSSRLTFFTNNAGASGEKMRITSGGNVGIGTTSPNATLHVNGGVHFGTDSAILNPTNGQVLIETVAGGTPRLQMYVYGSSVFDISSDGTTGNIGWSSGASREVNFQNTGAGGIKVGIATGAPTQPLDVNGYSICDKQFQRDNTLQTILNTPRVLNIGYRGANGTYTFNPVTLFGSLAQGGQCEIQVTGWQNKVNNGFIYWRDNGSNTNIGNGIVGFVQTAVVGSGAISVSTNSGTNNITIQFTGWHSNAHGWNCKIISYQA
jgi:hypothetical protein